MNIIGDVSNKRAILIDDLIDTAGTINSTEALMKLGQGSIRLWYSWSFIRSAVERIVNHQ